MINIKGFPLLHEDECDGLFSSDNMFMGNYFVKPEYKYLPNINGLSDEEKASYKFKNIKEGLYLVGLEIISNRWVNIGFCRSLLNCYGLVLCESNPIVKKGDRGDEESLIYLNFEHIAFSVDSVDVSVVS